MRRSSLALAGLLAVAASVPAIARMTAGRDGGARVFRSTKQTVAYRSAPTTTSNTRFRKVPSLDDVLIQVRGPATARFSGDFSGGPVEVRVVELPGDPLLPGTARFASTDDSSSFSYDFVDPHRRGGIECRRYAVSWRSPTGAEVTLNHGSLIVDYRFDDTSRDGLRSACVD